MRGVFLFTWNCEEEDKEEIEREGDKGYAGDGKRSRI